MQRRLIVLATVAVGLAALSYVQLVGLDRGLVSGRVAKLVDIERDIEVRFPKIAHANPKVVADKLAQGENDGLVLVDVREEAEFAVSRLPGAIRVQPGDTLASLQEKLDGREVGRTVIFYCSVGERSSRLAMRAKDQLLKAGAKDVQNLKGGIFGWHNQSRSLVNASGATDYVHPFDSNWGKLVKRQSKTRYQSSSPAPGE